MSRTTLARRSVMTGTVLTQTGARAGMVEQGWVALGEGNKEERCGYVPVQATGLLSAQGPNRGG
eukprot:1938281-Rhodomonas_salina.1